ncbi:MAG TPA: tRNA (adenosine(37)-N6)-threonylcarbamoyltransferase complex transferase subunit TsaD [Clostridiales bacterium]|nr:tRNA (adenosine(37)-N6)-threonylcarbamoyltransferase complex transferase subunit TsaD [Clostridiales bacterium]HQK74208.1 tRNA (adenosine(37)-N6)-threonylcarbamoyltransferase complex transferase subunit TsaD [Clostridiales bacterium]
MKILAIETSCDETAAAVVEDGRNSLFGAVASQIKEHAAFGGVVPEIASRMHAETICRIVSAALDGAGCGFGDIDAVAATFAPGLIGALLVGLHYAKGVSLARGIPLVGVHHLRAHIAANYIAYPGLEPPFLALVVSGGHSHIIETKEYTVFRVLGRTLDDAAGEALDKAARAMGFPYPGGMHLDAACRDGNPAAYRLPRPRVTGSRYDFSFSGLKTALLNTLNGARMRGESLDIPGLGASYIDVVTQCLVDNTARAAADFGHTKIVLAGGVAANSVLRRKMQQVCAARGLELFLPPAQLCGDNAVMVGAQAYYEYLAGNIATLDLNAFASMPIDG